MQKVHWTFDDPAITGEMAQQTNERCDTCSHQKLSVANKSRHHCQLFLASSAMHSNMTQLENSQNQFHVRLIKCFSCMCCIAAVNGLAEPFVLTMLESHLARSLRADNKTSKYVWNLEDPLVSLQPLFLFCQCHSID